MGANSAAKGTWGVAASRGALASIASAGAFAPRAAWAAATFPGEGGGPLESLARLLEGAGVALAEALARQGMATLALLHVGLVGRAGSAEGAEVHACAGFALWDLVALCLVAGLVFAVVRVRNRTAQGRLEVARCMIEQGMEPPADLLGDSGRGDLRRGLVWCFAGAGLLASGWAGVASGGGGPPASLGLIPIFIGLGYLLSHRFSVRAVEEGEGARDAGRLGRRGPGRPSSGAGTTGGAA